MWLQVVHAASSGSKWLQVACAASSGSKWLQVARSVSSGSKWLQMAPSGSCPSGTRLSICSKYPTALQVDPSRHDVKGPLPNRVLPQRPQLQSRFGRRPKVSDSVFLRVGAPTFTGHSRSNGTVSRGNGVASRFVTLQFLNGRCCTSGLVMITQPYQTPTTLFMNSKYSYRDEPAQGDFPYSPKLMQPLRVSDGQPYFFRQTPLGRVVRGFEI